MSILRLFSFRTFVLVALLAVAYGEDVEYLKIAKKYRPVVSLKKNGNSTDQKRCFDFTVKNSKPDDSDIYGGKKFKLEIPFKLQPEVKIVAPVNKIVCTPVVTDGSPASCTALVSSTFKGSDRFGTLLEGEVCITGKISGPYKNGKVWAIKFDKKTKLIKA